MNTQHPAANTQRQHSIRLWTLSVERFALNVVRNPALALAILLLASGTSCSTTPDTATPAAPAPAAAAKPAPRFGSTALDRLDADYRAGNTDYRLVPGDELDVRCPRHPELDYRTQVDTFGNITYPYVNSLHAQGMTTTELKTKLQDALTSSEYYRDPELVLRLASSRQNSVYVLGEVRRPGRIELHGTMGFLEALAEAGGATDDAKLDSIVFIRGSLTPPAAAKVNLKKALKASSPASAIGSFPLAAGDVLYVSPTAFASIERVFNRFDSIISPVVNLERGIVLYPDSESVISSGNVGEDRTIIRVVNP